MEVPITQLDKVLANKMMFDGSSIEGFVRIEESDMYLYPDLSTWVKRRTKRQTTTNGIESHQALRSDRIWCLWVAIP